MIDPVCSRRRVFAGGDMMNHGQRWSRALGMFGALVACNNDVEVGATSFAASGEDGVGSESTGATTSTVTSAAADESSSGDPADGSTTHMAIFDLGTMPPPPDDGIPSTCEEAAASESTIGCLFLAADLDSHPSTQTDAWGVAVGNIQPFDSEVIANITLEYSIGGTWITAEQVALPAGELHLFLPLQAGHESTGVVGQAAVRVRADVPITAFQLNPIEAGRATSDGSMLYPVSAWDHEYVIDGIAGSVSDFGLPIYPYVAIVAAYDGTIVEVVPSASTVGGSDIPAALPGEPIEVVLDAGDVLQISMDDVPGTMGGTTVRTDPTTPVGVFSGHRCGFVVTTACDHLEEQISGVHQWGREFIAARPPVRSTGGNIEPTIWHLVAGEDDTQVFFDAHDDVTGLPTDPVTMHAGEMLELTVGGTADHPGDFEITATRGIAVFQYMAGGGTVTGARPGWGDPSAVQIAPIDQFLERMVVLAPPKWSEDFLVITRPEGTTVTVDGDEVDDDVFVPVGDGSHEVGTVPVADGAHAIESEAPISVIVGGYDSYDSYAYLGGSRTSFINRPQG
jgi:hypothetical protein